MNKNLLRALALAAALAGRASATASTAVVPVLQTPNGSYVSAVAAPNLSFIGAAVYRVEVSTPVDTPVLLLAGQGVLYGIHCGSGTASGYELTFDSATSAGITVATTGKALHAPLYSPGQTSGSVNVGLLDFTSNPVQFTNGIVAITHGSALNCYLRARLTTGANPGP